MEKITHPVHIYYLYLKSNEIYRICIKIEGFLFFQIICFWMHFNYIFKGCTYKNFQRKHNGFKLFEIEIIRNMFLWLSTTFNRRRFM